MHPMHPSLDRPYSARELIQEELRGMYEDEYERRASEAWAIRPPSLALHSSRSSRGRRYPGGGAQEVLPSVA